METNAPEIELSDAAGLRFITGFKTSGSAKKRGASLQNPLNNWPKGYRPVRFGVVARQLHPGKKDPVDILGYVLKDVTRYTGEKLRELRALRGVGPVRKIKLRREAIRIWNEAVTLPSFTNMTITSTERHD